MARKLLLALLATLAITSNSNTQEIPQVHEVSHEVQEFQTTISSTNGYLEVSNESMNLSISANGDYYDITVKVIPYTQGFQGDEETMYFVTTLNFYTLDILELNNIKHSIIATDRQITTFEIWVLDGQVIFNQVTDTKIEVR